MSYLPILAFAAPLGTDSAAVCTAMGARERIVWRRRFLIAGTLTVFEAGMPAVGMAVSGPVGGFLGQWAAWIAGALLVGLGLLMLKPDSDDDGKERDATGMVALLGLGVAVSVDEIAVGISLGLNGTALLPLVLTIAVWVFAATLAGLTLGARIGERFHDRAGKVAALALIALGALVALGIL